MTETEFHPGPAKKPLGVTDNLLKSSRALLAELLQRDEREELIATARSCLSAAEEFAKENERLRAEREQIVIEIENLTGALPGNHEPTVDEIVAAVKFVCDQRDYALENVKPQNFFDAVRNDKTMPGELKDYWLDMEPKE